MNFLDQNVLAICHQLLQRVSKHCSKLSFIVTVIKSQERRAKCFLWQYWWLLGFILSNLLPIS